MGCEIEMKRDWPALLRLDLSPERERLERWRAIGDEEDDRKVETWAGDGEADLVGDGEGGLERRGPKREKRFVCDNNGERREGN